MPSYTNKAINTNEMQKWRNAINPDSVSQITNLVNQKADQSDLNTTNDNVNGLTSNLVAISTDPTFNASDNTKSATLGTELVDSTGWTVPSGWTGDSVNGFKNTVGNLNPLTRSMGSTGTNLYQVSFYVSSPSPAGVPNASSDFTVELGNSDPFITYQGGGSVQYTFGIQSVSDGPLVFTPGSTFDGTIKNVSVKQITGTLNPSMSLKDSSNNNVLEVRTSQSSLYNTFIGNQSGQTNTTGYENVSLGDLSLVNNTTGYWNTVLGKQALQFNTVGSRNVALGYLALNANISGDRNVAIGSFTLERNTTGRQNIALGADCLWVNTTGSQNIAMGMGTMGSSTTGNSNIALGYSTMNANVSGNYNIAIGYNALYNNVSTDNNIAIGREALKNTTASVNIGIGYGAAALNTTGYSNTAIGYNALNRNTTGQENTVVGHYAVASGTSGAMAKNTIFGAWAGNVLTSGANNNTLIGYGAGKAITTGIGNIIIGYNADFVGAPTTSNMLNIGNVIYGKLNSSIKQFGFGISSPTAAIHLPASNGGAGTAPIKLEAATGLMTVHESGAIEYDGTNLYFTDSTGARHQLAVVA